MLGLIAVILTIPTEAETSERTDITIPREPETISIWVPRQEISEVVVTLDSPILGGISPGRIVTVLGADVIWTGVEIQLATLVPETDGKPASDTASSDATNYTVSQDSDNVKISWRPNEPKTFPTVQFYEPELVRSLTVVTPTFDPKYFWIRFAIWITALLALAWSVLSFRSVVRPGSILRKKDTRETRQRVRLTAAPALFSLTVLIVSALVNTPKHDDGWIFHRSESFLSRGFFGTIYSNVDAMVPQGWLSEIILAGLIATGASGTALRVVSAGFIGLIWIGISGLIARKTRLGSTPTGQWFSAGIYTAFGSYYLVGFRPEIFVVALSVLFFFFMSRFQRTKNPSDLLLGLAAAGQTVISHQSGFVLLFPALAFFVVAASQAHREQNLRRFYLVSLIAGLFTYITAVIPADPKKLFGEGDKFLSSSHSPQFIGGEIQRLLSVLELDGTGSRIIFASLLTSTALVLTEVIGRKASSLGSSQERSSEYLLAVSLMFFPLGLVLTSTKWEWHLAVLAVPFALLPGVLSDNLGKGHPLGQALLSAPGVLLACFTLLTARSPFIDQPSEALLDLFLAGFSRAATLVATGTVILGVLVYLFRGKAKKSLPLILFPTVGLGLSMSTVAPSALALLTQDELSLSKVQLSEMNLWSDLECGVFSDTSVVTNARSLLTVSNKDEPNSLTPFGLTLATPFQPTQLSPLRAEGNILGLWGKSSKKSELEIRLAGDNEETTLSLVVQPSEAWNLLVIPPQEFPVRNFELRTTQSEIEVTELAALVIQPAPAVLPGKSLLTSPAWFNPQDCSNRVVVKSSVVQSIDVLGDLSSMSPAPPRFQINVPVDGTDRAKNLYLPTPRFPGAE